jgi:hypothetical protein
MNEDLKTIQETIMNSLEKLEVAVEDIGTEVARSNAVSQLANTYIKSCNLLIRVEESKLNLKSKIDGVIKNEE